MLKHVSYFLYPIFFEENDFNKITHSISETDIWKPVNENYLNILVRQMTFNVSNFFRNSELTKIYEYDNNILSNKLFSNSLLEFRPGDSYIPFRVEKILLFLSFNGNGFIILKVQVESEKDDILKFNGSFDIIEPLLEDKKKFFLQVPRKIIHRKCQPDYSGNYFCPDNRILADNLDEFFKEYRNGKYFYLRDALKLILNNSSHICSGLADDNPIHSKLLKFSVCSDDFDDQEFSKKLSSFRTIFDDPYTILKDKNRYKPFENTELYFSLEGGTMYISGKESKLSITLFNNSEQFLCLMLICFVQKMTFSKIFHAICTLSTDIKSKKLSSNKIISRINKTNLFFINSFSILWFNCISDNNMLNTCYNFWQKTLRLEKDYEEVKNKLELFNDYMDRRNQRRFNLFSDAITCIFFPLTIVAGLLGMNVSELGVGYNISLFSTIFINVAAVCFMCILVVRVWIYFNDKDK